MKREDTGMHPGFAPVTRRQFLAAGGALVLAFSLRPHIVLGQAKPGAKPPAKPADKLPGDLRTSPLLVPLAQALVITPLVIRMVLPVLRSVDSRLRALACE